jgi:hypothetical protein
MAKKTEKSIIIQNIFSYDIHVDGILLPVNATREFKEMTQELENLKMQKYIRVIEKEHVE